MTDSSDYPVYTDVQLIAIEDLGIFPHTDADLVNLPGTAFNNMLEGFGSAALEIRRLRALVEHLPSLREAWSDGYICADNGGDETENPYD